MRLCGQIICCITTVKNIWTIEIKTMRFGEKNYNASGQVLIVGLIIVLILLLTIFIFFDIHNIIRAKIKVETAEQAAALAGARWQGESLNLIGELNLLIANEAILNSSAVQTPAGIVEIRNRMSAGVKAINELQTRVAFMGPLIGLSAAQQAAKNNGISAKNSGYDIDLYRFSIENNEPEEQSKYPDKVKVNLLPNVFVHNSSPINSVIEVTA